MARGTVRVESECCVHPQSGTKGEGILCVLGARWRRGPVQGPLLAGGAGSRAKGRENHAANQKTAEGRCGGGGQTPCRAGTQGVGPSLLRGVPVLPTATEQLGPACRRGPS